MVALTAVVVAGLGSLTLASPRATASAADPYNPGESVLRITGPAKVAGSQLATLTLSWTTEDGQPVAGGSVALQRRESDGSWTTVATLTTDATGTATRQVQSVGPSTWRAIGAAFTTTDGEDVAGVTSEPFALAGNPQGRPVRLPAHAPEPRRLPPQPPAVGAGANPVVTRIPDVVWQRMDGISWHPGCPVGRAGLRLLQINYWDFSGYRRRGELIAATGAIGRMGRALAAMYARHYPLRSLRPIDYFGYSRRTHGGNDYAAMAADDTSAFDCRWVDGKPGVLSPHALGYSIDINTFENPYDSVAGAVPDSWWLSRSAPRIAWRSANAPLVRLLRRYGLVWTYRRTDPQHFDLR